MAQGDEGRAREWMARALNARRDPAWTADAFVSDHWQPISPVSGRLDAFEWKDPLAGEDHGTVIEHRADAPAAPATPPAIEPPPADTRHRAGGGGAAPGAPLPGGGGGGGTGRGGGGGGTSTSRVISAGPSPPPSPRRRGEGASAASG